MTEQNLGWPGLIYYSSVEKLVRCEDLVGKQFLACSGENEKLVVSCRDGSYLINLNNTSQLFWQDSFLQVSAGKNFLVGIGLNNSLYSWGVDGDHGQLGQGASVKKIFEPLEVPFKANFQDVSCGEAFSVAVDDKGFAYAWGENFDRQLGIYTKTKEKMHIPNAVIEEVIFNPRIIPLSMKIPMQKVVCGSRFVLALTQGGKLFSWGAGESGQLGTGRCTRRDIPEEVNLPDNVSYSVKDIACGNGHALAIVDNGAIYSWGLNHRGQCGLGDIKARHFPVLITPSSPRSSNNRITYRKVIADGHSSAAIDDQGKLWTWGSITYGRLLHTLPDEPLPNPDGMKEKIDMTIRQPKLVVSDVITTQTRIEQFVFSRERSAILVKTTVTDISPKKGPKRTFSKLTIHGYGFWESPQIIIKFTANSYSIYNPPRSCLGKFVSSNQLTCKPPKFAEIGMYTVTVSMDGGKEFLPQSYEVLIYKDMTLISQSPSIIDLRAKFIPTLTLKANALKVDVQDLNQVYVKLLFYSINDINDFAAAVHPKKSSSVETKTIVAEIVVTGDLTPLESNSSELPPPPTDPEVATYTDQSTANSQTNRTATSDEVLLQIQCKDIDLSKYSAITSSFNLYELQCSISMNAQDFAVIKDSSSKTEKAEAKEPGGAAVTGGAAVVGGADQGGAASTSSICHSFTPKTALPNYYSLTNLLTLKDVTEQDEKEDAEKNVNINEFNPFNPEGNLLLQQREEKYHQFDKKIVLHGESFFLTNKLPKGSHIKVITHQIQLIPLLYQHHKGGSSPQGGDVQILTITKEEIQEQLQELLIHCETKTQAHFTLNYHYLMELSRFLSSYLTTHTEGSSLTLQDFKIELQFQFYLELASSHSSHYYHQQQQQFNLPPLPLSTVSGGPAGSTDSYTSEKLLLSPDFVAVTIMKDMQILLSPALMKKFPKLIEGEEEASPTSLIKIIPKELLAFPFQSSIFNIALQIPKLILDPTNTNQQYDIPPYLLSKEAISSQSLSSGETETLSEQLIPLATEYFSVATTIPSYQMILDYAYRYVSNFPSSSTLTLTSSNELQTFLKTVTLAIYYETPSPSTQPVMSAPIYYYNSLHQYSLQNPLPKGGAVKETTVSLLLEEYLPVAIASASMTACVRIRGQDASKELILPANMTEITNAAGVQQTVISFTISEPPKVIELGAVMNGKEKTFYVDIGLKPIRSSEGEGGSIAVFDNAVSPILVMK